MTGMPALGVPAGIQLVGRPRADTEMLQPAKAYEQRTNRVRDHPPPAG